MNKCYKTSLEKEKKQQNFYKCTTFANLKTGESYQITHSFEKYYKKYTKSIEQKIYAIEALARKKALVPVFMTFTLPKAIIKSSSPSSPSKKMFSLVGSFLTSK